jgi:hypothetical protein
LLQSRNVYLKDTTRVKYVVEVPSDEVCAPVEHGCKPEIGVVLFLVWHIGTQRQQISRGSILLPDPKHREFVRCIPGFGHLHFVARIFSMTIVSYASIRQRFI